jgi:multiple sugar transport system permease protein
MFRLPGRGREVTTVQVPPTGATGAATHARPVVPAQADAGRGARGKRPPSAQGISRLQRFAAYTLLILGAIAFLIPFYFVFNASLKGQAEVEAGDFSRPVVLPPREPGTRLAVDTAPAVVTKAIGGGTLLELYERVVPGTEPGDPPVRSFIARVQTTDNKGLREMRIAADGTVISDVPFRTGPRWDNYVRALAPEKMNFWPALSNTVVVTTLSVVGQIISCSLVGFGFARFRFRGRGILFMVMLSTLMLPAQVTMIPVFVLFRSMGMIDSFWPLIIPQWLASPFFVFMFRQFFAQVPEELIEAARIDGAGNWRIYWQLMLPLSGPVIAIVAIYTFLASWNDFLGPLIYLNSPENRTIALALNAFRGQYGISDVHLLMAASVVCMLPCIVLFFAMQKYFVESVAMSGLKS